MPMIQLKTIVPASPEAVYEYVTAYAITGRTGRRALEEKYGRLVGRDGDTYSFQDTASKDKPNAPKDDSPEGVIWRCTFDPPNRRIMEALDPKWADRTDWFEPWDEGTLWTIVWVGKSRGFRTLAQWLLFQVKGKRQATAGVVRPVVAHFEEVNARQT